MDKPLTVREVTALTGVSARALHYYDTIGLLRPARAEENGYRLYDRASLRRLRDILLWKELDLPLKEIRAWLDSPGYDRERALEEQIALLEARRERDGRLLALARSLRNGGDSMDFTAFDKNGEYAREAEARWGGTEAWAAYREKPAASSPEAAKEAGEGLMALFAELGPARGRDPASPEAAAWAERLQSYLTEHFYPCTDAILASLAEMYAAPGEMRDNIDRAAGPGTADFAAAVIREKGQGSRA